MIINTPISLGELLDKISILEIKRKKIKHKEKIFFIKKELILLKNILKKKFSKNRAISKYLEKLIKINLKLWSIEDNLRQCEKVSHTWLNYARRRRPSQNKSGLRFSC